MRERTWISAFRLEELIASALSTGAPEDGRAPNGSSDAEQIARIVEQVVERKLREKRDSAVS